MDQHPIQSLPSFESLEAPLKRSHHPNHNEMVLILSSKEICRSLNDIENCISFDDADFPKLPIKEEDDHLSIE